MINIGNYFEIWKKDFYNNNVDEYIILLNLKDRIINIFKYDPYHVLISLLDLLLYEDKKNEFVLIFN